MGRNNLLEDKSGKSSGMQKEKNIMNFVKFESKRYVIPFIMLILGILFILLQGNVLDVLVTVLGVILMIGAVVLGLSLLSTMSPLVIFGASTLFILGLISVVNPGWVSNFFLKVVGLCIFLNSLVRIIVEHSLKGTSDKYNIYLITDIVSAVVGLLLFLFPKTWLESVSFLFYVFGIVLVILGIFNLYTAYKVYKEGRFVNDGTDVVWEE